MSESYQINDQSAVYYLTFQIVNWIDLFTRQIYRDIAIDSLKYCQENKGLEIFAYVIMSNHIHIIARSSENKIVNTIRDFKRHTSKQFIKTIQNESKESRKKWLLMLFNYETKKHTRNKNFQVWTHENHPVEIYSNKFIEQKVNYIHQNPVRNGLVENSEDYMYSSARNYAGKEGLLDITKIDIRWKSY